MANFNIGVGTHLEPMWEGGGYGASTTRHGRYTFAAAGSGSVAYLARIPKGSLILRVHYKSADMGTGTKISIGTKEGSTVAATKITGAVDVATAVTPMKLADFAPFMIKEDTDIILTTSVAAASGQFDVLVDYVFFGTAHVTKFSY